MLLIVVGIAFDRVRFAERHKLVLACTLLAGDAIFPFGVLLQTFDHGAIPRGSPFSISAGDCRADRDHAGLAVAKLPQNSARAVFILFSS